MPSPSTPIGRNIRQLRKQAGLTLRELSERIGIHAPPLSNIERGVHMPSSRVIEALARTLDVPVHALFADSDAVRGRIVQRNTAEPFYVDGGERPLPPKAEAMAKNIIDDVRLLEDLCDAAKRAEIPLHVPADLTEAGMERMAETVRGFFSIGRGVIFDYYELFEAYGFRVIVCPLPRELNSFSYYDPANYNAFFFIDGTNNPEKQIFRLVYELGRIYLLSARLYGPADGRTAPMDERHAASKFAAFFLMPDAAVRKTVDQLGIGSAHWTYELLLRIKHRFGVSAESFLYRLNELALIEPALSDELKERILEHYRETGYEEPDSTRRLLTPNGRVWDLVAAARGRDGRVRQVAAVEGRLKTYKVVRV